MLKESGKVLCFCHHSVLIFNVRQNLTHSSSQLDRVDGQGRDTSGRIEIVNNRIESISNRVDVLTKLAHDLRDNATKIQELDVTGRKLMTQTVNEIDVLSFYMCKVPVVQRRFTEILHLLMFFTISGKDYWELAPFWCAAISNEDFCSAWISTRMAVLHCFNTYT